MEEPQWKLMALMVPDTIRIVATSKEVLASIRRACDVLSENIWSVGYGGDLESLSKSTGGRKRKLVTTCGGEHTFAVPLVSTGCGERIFRFGAPVPWVPIDTIGGGERGFGFHLESTGGGDHIHDDDGSEFIIDRTSDTNYWANILAGAFAHDGPLTVAHREITRLITLHGQAGHVLNACAKRLGLELHDDGDDALLKRWREHRAAVVPRAHDALLRLSSAASAAAAAEDFIRLSSAEAESQRRAGWRSEVMRLVRDARRDVGEARDAVMRMREAAMRELFETRKILKRA